MHDELIIPKLERLVDRAQVVNDTFEVNVYLRHLDFDFAYLVIDDTSVQFETKVVVAITG